MGIPGETQAVSGVVGSEAAARRLKQARDEGVVNGMAIAAAIIVRVWGDEVQAEEILGAAGLTSMDEMRRFGIDAYDVMPLRNVIRRLSGRRQPIEVPRSADTTDRPAKPRDEPR